MAPWVRKSAASDTDETIVVVTVNDRIRPMDRVERYEDALDHWLGERAPGSAVVGGGTQLLDSGEIDGSDIEVSLVGDADAGVRVVTVVLESRGVPVGSRLVVGDQPPVELGRTRGVAVYLDGTGLPDEVYATSEVNEVIAALEAAVEDLGPLPFHSFWEGPTESALYFYAEDRDLLRQRLTAELERHPLAQGCRVVDLPDTLS